VAKARPSLWPGHAAGPVAVAEHRGNPGGSADRRSLGRYETRPGGHAGTAPLL